MNEYQRFFDFMEQEHDLILTVGKMQDIINESLIAARETGIFSCSCVDDSLPAPTDRESDYPEFDFENTLQSR